jgi:hypothetical protein
MPKRIIAGISALLAAAILLAGSCTGTAPSSNTTQTPPTSTIDTIGIAISHDQALAVASQYLPEDAVSQSAIVAYLDKRTDALYSWMISFSGFSMTRSELTDCGWKEDGKTIFPDYPYAEYHYAVFNIDADTGKVLCKAVYVKQEELLPVITAVAWIPGERPIETVSIQVCTSAPEGPTIEVKLKNMDEKAIVYVDVSLGLTIQRSEGLFDVAFDVTASQPLICGETIAAARLLDGAGYEAGQYCPVFIHGTFQNGDSFQYTQYVQVLESP